MTKAPSTRQYFQGLFDQGAFRKILEKSVEAGVSLSIENGLAFVVGALAFVGRPDDGVTLFSNQKSHWTAESEDLALCRFALGLGLIRVSRYEEGLHFLKQNLMLARANQKNHRLCFFAFQGMAFYRYFQCRFRSSLFFARQSWKFSFGDNYQYGQALAADLRGHSLLRTGEVALGLKSLGEAERLAKSIGNAALLDNIRSSLVWYRSCYGLDGAQSIDQLRSVIKKMDSQDNFSLAAAQVELAHRLSLHGNLDESEKMLESAARVILEAGHNRQKSALLHRFAWNRFLAGRHLEALDYLTKSDRILDERFDLQHLLANAGLRSKIARTRDATSHPDDHTRVIELSARTGTGIGRNILWREDRTGTPTVDGDDPLGDLCHLMSGGKGTPYADLVRVIESGYLGLLNDGLSFPAGSRVVLIDLIPGDLFIFDAGNVFRSGQSVSASLKSLFIILGRGAKSKKDLVEMLWGYTYHSLRHDPMLYAQINRLRRALGDRGEWLISDTGGYQFSDGISIIVYEHDANLPHAGQIRNNEEKSANTNSDSISISSDFNHRQLVILSELKRRDFLSASECASLFNVSRITATRDLADLTARSYLTKIGKARATRYALSKFV